MPRLNLSGENINASYLKSDGSKPDEICGIKACLSEKKAAVVIVNPVDIVFKGEMYVGLNIENPDGVIDVTGSESKPDLEMLEKQMKRIIELWQNNSKGNELYIPCIFGKVDSLDKYFQILIESLENAAQKVARDNGLDDEGYKKLLDKIKIIPSTKEELDLFNKVIAERKAVEVKVEDHNEDREGLYPKSEERKAYEVAVGAEDYKEKIEDPNEEDLEEDSYLQSEEGKELENKAIKGINYLYQEYKSRERNTAEGEKIRELLREKESVVLIQSNMPGGITMEDIIADAEFNDFLANQAVFAANFVNEDHWNYCFINAKGKIEEGESRGDGSCASHTVLHLLSKICRQDKKKVEAVIAKLRDCTLSVVGFYLDEISKTQSRSLHRHSNFFEEFNDDQLEKVKDALLENTEMESSNLTLARKVVFALNILSGKLFEHLNKLGNLTEISNLIEGKYVAEFIIKFALEAIDGVVVLEDSNFISSSSSLTKEEYIKQKFFDRDKQGKISASSENARREELSQLGITDERFINAFFRKLARESDENNKEEVLGDDKVRKKKQISEDPSTKVGVVESGRVVVSSKSAALGSN